MKKLNVAEIAEIEQRSPNGKFRSWCRNISIALGGIRNVGPSHGGHPFDVQIRRIPAGAAVCPFHLHVGQWEMFYVQSGQGTVRAGADSCTVQAGDVFVHPPGEAHQLTNTGSEDLSVLIVADNPPVDACYYPDSNKWSLRPGPGIFRITPADYFDGEEPAAPDSAVPAAVPRTFPPSTPFAERKRSIESIPWEILTSPGGKYRAASKELSIALGAKYNTASGLGGHPFDLELGKLAPGEVGVPYHCHALQWELFYIVSGHGAVRTPEGILPVQAGDVVLQLPGDRHQIRNPGTEDLVYLLVADNPLNEFCHYPDSNKWGFKSPRKVFRLNEADYWDGEE